MKLEREIDRSGSELLRRSLSIGAPATTILHAWSNSEVMQKVLGPAASLISQTDGTTRWRIDAPLGQVIEMVVKEDTSANEEFVRHVGRTISGPQAEILVELHTRPAAADFGTDATFIVEYTLAGGVLADAAIKLLGVAPNILLGHALRRLKALLESGEIPTLAHNPSGRSNPPTDDEK